MNPAYYSCFIMVIVLLLVILPAQRNERYAAAVARRQRQRRNTNMAAMVEEFIGKECILYTLNSQVTGTVRAVNDGWVSVESGSGTEALNLDFIIRVREYPRNKNGKKKSVVLD